MRPTLASLLVKGRGFSPRGGGRVQVTVDPIECVGRCVLRPLLLDCDNGALVKVVGLVCGTLPRIHLENCADSLRASIQLALSSNRIRNQLLNDDCSSAIDISYEAMSEESRRSAGSHNLSIDLVAHFSSGAVNACNLLIDGQGRKKSKGGHSSRNEIDVEVAAEECFDKFLEMIDDNESLDEHTMDQVFLYMALADGVSRVRYPSKLTSMHIETVLHYLSLIVPHFRHSMIEQDGRRVVEVQGVGFDWSAM